MDLTGDDVLESRSLSAQGSAARELRCRAAWIDLDAFASKTDRAPAGGEEAMQISLPRLPGGRAPSLKEYQERLRSVNGLKEGAGEGEERPDPARAGAARGRRDQAGEAAQPGADRAPVDPLLDAGGRGRRGGAVGDRALTPLSACRFAPAGAAGLRARNDKQTKTPEGRGERGENRDSPPPQRLQ